MSLKSERGFMYPRLNHILNSENAIRILNEKHIRSIDVPQPLINDLWAFLFLTIDTEYLK